MQDKDKLSNVKSQDDITQIVEELVTKKNDLMNKEAISDEEYQRFIDEGKTILLTIDALAKQYVEEVKAFNEKENKLNEAISLERQKREALITKLNEVVAKEQQRIQAMQTMANAVNNINDTISTIKKEISVIKKKQDNLETLVYVAITVSIITLLMLMYFNWR